MGDPNGNPFADESLTNHPSVEAQPANGNPFADESLTAASGGADTGQVTNDVGNTVIVPKDGESFADTMQRAAAHGKTVTQDQLNKEESTIPKKAAQTLAAAPIIGAGGTAALTIPGEVADLALKHLAGNVLPGMETQAAKQALINALPKVAQFAETMGKLGIGVGGLTYLFKSLIGDGKK